MPTPTKDFLDNLISSNFATLANRSAEFGFSAAANFCYYRARYYSPTIQRFVSEDPLGYAGNSVNFYEYAYDDPANLIDPSGMQSMFSSPGQVLTTQQNFISWLDAANDAGDMTWDFLTGTGPEHRYFGPDSVEVSNLKYSPGINRARDYFNSHGCQPILNGGHNFGLKGLSESGLDPTLQFIGSYNWMALPNGNGTVTFTVTNDTSMTSLFYHLAPSWDRDPFGLGWSLPGGTISQTYYWTERMTGKGCGCK